MSTEPEPSTDSIRTGKTVGSWYLERYAGHGSYGLVYKARHVSRPGSVPVAFKIAMAPNDQRLFREGDLLSRVHHSSIPGLVDRGVWHSIEGHAYPFLVMQWIEGLPMYRWARTHGASSRQVLRALEQVAGALEAVHAAGALHRDVKGDNILVEHGGRAFLTDFGSGSWEDASPLTETLMPPGTRGYRGPEALRFQRNHSGQHHVHYKARPFDDLYALGVSGYRVVTGKHPPPGTEQEPGNSPYRAPLPARMPPQALNARVVPELAALIERMLAAEPEARGSAQEASEAASVAAQKAGPEADVPLADAEKVPPEVDVPLPDAAKAPPEKGVAAPAPVRAATPEREGLKLRKLVLPALTPLLVWVMIWLSHLGPHSPPLRFVQEEDPKEKAERLREAAVADASVSASVEREALERGPSSLAREVPSEPLPRQRRKPCRSREVEIRGGCWDWLGNVTPPCDDDNERYYEWKGGCYLPKFEPGRPHTSDKKKQQ
jgi:serine/threonine protein kinase